MRAARRELFSADSVATSISVSTISLCDGLPITLMSHRFRSILIAAALCLHGAQSAAQQLPPPLSETQLAEVRAALDSMKQDPRGPYLRIRWYCADGSVLAPEPYACTERGGGAMHAELKPGAKSLARLGFRVGTILQATPRDSLFDQKWDHQWLRELVLQQYLVEVDDGWVLRQARFYRGAKQIEDEEQRGRELLEWLLVQPDWAARNYFLLLRLSAVVPHPGSGGERSSERIRNLASEMADLEPRFQPLRVKIHSFPSREDLDSVHTWIARPGLGAASREKLAELREALAVQYDQNQGAGALEWYQGQLRSTVGAEVGSIAASYRAGRTREVFEGIAALTPTVRRLAVDGSNGRRNLLLLDLQRNLLELAFVLTQDLDGQQRENRPRIARLAYVDQLAALVYGAGLLSARELGAVDGETNRLRSVGTLTAIEYKHSVGYLSRSLDWATGTVRGEFSLVVDRYAAVEPKALGFVDAQLRGSLLLPLSQELGRLSADADRVLGASHVFLGEELSHGVRGLNPGVAIGPLEVVPPDAVEVHFDENRIYVLPATLPELRPVAGVLTLDEGNLLSHVQLLARNLGIPNAAVIPAHLPRLNQAAGREVFFAVTPLGRVLLKEPSRLSALERSLVEQGRQTGSQRIRLDTGRLRLERTDPILLGDLRASASGVWVGPKAANLGQLAFYFPDKVAPGVALPFGMFYQHANRPFGGISRTVLEQLDAAYREADGMRRAGRSETEIDEYMFGALARARQAILELPWLPETLRAIEQAVQEAFGGELEQGVFVRSDTNVEDLPQFSGAGLNLTVAHQTDLAGVLASIRRVWTSPFSERAYLWRKQILEEQGRIYPSVLLLRSVPSAKSGVLITSGLDEGGPDDLTIAAAEGVGGAVEGEDAETIVVRPGGSVRLLSQAKAPSRRALAAGGGVVLLAPVQPEYLLTDSEIAQLREVVQTFKTRFAPRDDTVWDMEYGFADGRLWLFQVRPFVQFRSSALLDRLRVLDREVLRNANRVVSLTEAV